MKHIKEILKENQEDLLKKFNELNFDYNTFKEELKDSDLLALEYLEKTIIKAYKERRTNDYTYYDYIINLFYAVRDLNECVFIYELTKVENNFKYDLYTETRDLLFKELGFDIEDLFN